MNDATTRPILSRRTFLIVLVALCALRLALNAIVPLMDPSEARYALICKIMAGSGNYLEPKLIHEGVLMNFEGKPPLCFQAGAVACKLLGVNLFAVRLPSFLFAAGLLAVMYGALRRVKGEAAAQLAVLLTASSVVFFLYAGMCMTDMALAFCVCSGVFCYMLFDHEEKKLGRKLASVGFFASLALGMLVKGPVALVLAGLPVFLFVLLGNRWSRLKDHAWIAGTAVFLLIAAPWYVLMQRANPDFLYYFFVNENFKRFLFKEYGDQYGAGREFFRGMALVWFLISSLPPLLFVAFPLFDREARRKLAGVWRKRSLADDLPLLGVATITLFWCLTSRVLITYVLPVVPFLGAWLGIRLTEWNTADGAGFRRAVRAGLPVVWCVTAAVFAAFPFMAERWIDKMPGEFFAKAAETAPEGQFYFYRRVPYSAYYYLGDRVIPHAKEEAEPSEAASLGHYLIGTKHDLKRHPPVRERRLLLENGVWALYAPAGEP